jgi:putative Mg2+ transporter-C (MgtC) family protein
METLAAYWSKAELITNGLVMLHLAGAAAVGLLLGYERTYHGRAAGMRTYALVCAASTILTVINAYPDQWFGGLSGVHGAVDPTRSIQGIMTGIGFLGAGVIMKEGFTIRGLSTAASIWMTAAIGVVIGVGFYGAAFSATFIAVTIMTALGWLEKLLPRQTTMHLSLVFSDHKIPTTEEVQAYMRAHQFEVLDWSFQKCKDKKQFQYDLVLQAQKACRSHDLVSDLTRARELVEFRLSPSRA